MSPETPPRAVPIETEAEELKKATPEELKKIREQAEKDSKKSRDLNDPAYVTALNRGWAKHYGDSHPLSKKILEFKGESGEREADEKAAMDAVKSIQTQLGFTGEDIDGIISYKTIKAYNKMLENKTEKNVGPTKANSIELQLNKIDELGKEEKESATLLGDTGSGSGVNVNSILGGGNGAINGTLNNSNMVMQSAPIANTERPETEEAKTARLEGEKEKKTEYYKGLKERMDAGYQDLNDADDNRLTRIKPDGGEEYLQRPDGKILNFDNGEFETQAERATRLEEKNEGKEDGNKRLRELKLNALKGVEENPRLQENTREYVFEDVTYTFDKEKQGWKNAQGEFLDTDTGELVPKEKKEGDAQKELAKETKETAYGMFRGVGGGKNLEDVKMSDLKIQFVDNSQKSKIRQIMENAGDIKELKGITYGEYVDMLESPLKAAQKFATTDKPTELPGKLGEYGVKYQKNERDEVLTYREGSEVPKILQDGREVDIQEYFGDRVLESLSLGGGKEIKFTSNEGGKKEYALIEKQEGKVIATRKIKEDGTLENVSEGTLIAAKE